MLIVHQDRVLLNFYLFSCSERNGDSNRPLCSALFLNSFHFFPHPKTISSRSMGFTLIRGGALRDYYWERWLDVQ